MLDFQGLIDWLTNQGAWTEAWIVAGQILLIVVATFIALRFAQYTVKAALDRLFDREVAEGTAQEVPALEVQRRRHTLEGLVYRAVRILILIIAFLMILTALDLDIGPAIAGLGIVGLALSLGAQHLVRDYVAGAFVLIENQYSKGDTVAIAGVTGTVEDVSLRRTTLRDSDGTVHYVPHGLIQTASNLTRSWAGIALDIPVGYGLDLALLSDAVDAAARRLADDPAWRLKILEAPRVESIERLGEEGLLVRVVGKVAPLSRFAAAGEVRRLIVEEAARRKLSLGWRAPSTLSPDPDSQPGRKTGTDTPAEDAAATMRAAAAAARDDG